MIEVRSSVSKSVTSSFGKHGRICRYLIITLAFFLSSSGDIPLSGAVCLVLAHTSLFKDRFPGFPDLVRFHATPTPEVRQGDELLFHQHNTIVGRSCQIISTLSFGITSMCCGGFA